MSTRIIHCCYLPGVLWLALSLILSSVPRCDLILDFMQGISQTNSSEPTAKLACHGPAATPKVNAKAQMKRACPCVLQIFPLVILDWNAPVMQVIAAEQLLFLVQTLYRFSLKTHPLQLATPPPRQASY